MTNRCEDVDEEFLMHTFELLLSENEELEPYILSFEIVHSDDKFIGTYSNDRREIKINQKALETFKRNRHLYSLSVVKHEIEHARNLMTLEHPRDDMESLTVNYSLKDFAIRNHLDCHSNVDQLNPFLLRFYIRENYETNPGERLVEIRTWKYLVNLLKNQRISEDLLVSRMMLYYSYIRGYQDNRYYLEAPTYQFLLKTGMFHEYVWLKNRVSKKNYNLETRLMYGLPITENEHDQKVLQKVKLRIKE